MAAIATGNNLLFLLLGAMLGLIVVSGALSEVVIRDLRVSRRIPRGGTAGHPVGVLYQVENRKRRLPSFAVVVRERKGKASAFIPVIHARQRAAARLEETFSRRGVYPLYAVTLSTSFPFGLFEKERDLELPGELLIWPRTSRPVREARTAGERIRRRGRALAGSAGGRGEFRGLREYRPGDDPRDVHWRSTARLGEPVVREYERDLSRDLWLCLDLRTGDEDAAEDAVELAAALAARAVLRDEPVALETGEARVRVGSGPEQLHRILDVLARADLRPDAPPPAPPVPRPACVLVTAAAGAAGYGDTVRPG